jgi:hypothetical protein
MSPVDAVTLAGELESVEPHAFLVQPLQVFQVPDNILAVVGPGEAVEASITEINVGNRPFRK